MAKEEKQVIIVPESESEPKSYWSLVKYGKYTWKHKWWVLGATVLCGVAGLLVTKFAVNPSKAKHNSEFSLNLAIEVEKDKQGKVIGERFINGQPFNYSEIISKEALSKVKNSKEEYKNINVDKIFEKGGISISIKNIDEKTLSDNLTHYVLVANSSYFSSDSQAQSFISDVVNLQKVRNENAIKSFEVKNFISSDLPSFEFVHQLQNIESQYDAINGMYQDLVESFPSTAVIGEGKTIQTEYASFTNKFKFGSGTVISDLSGQLVTNGYVKYTPGEEAEKIAEVREQSEGYKEALRKNINAIASYNNNLTSLINSAVITPEDNAYFKKVLELENNIEKLQLENSELLKTLKINGYDNTDLNVTTLTHAEINAIAESATSGVLYHLANPTIGDWASKCVAFGEQIAQVSEDLKTYRVASTDVFHTAYLNYQNQINFYTPGVVSSSGGIPSAVVAVVAAVVGLLASSLIVTAIEISKEKEAK